MKELRLSASAWILSPSDELLVDVPASKTVELNERLKVDGRVYRVAELTPSDSGGSVARLRPSLPDMEVTLSPEMRGGFDRTPGGRKLV